MPVPKGTRIGGRKKGTPNKATAELKEAIQGAFEAKGGMDGLIAWANRDEANERLFYSQILMKILPKEIKADVEQRTTQIFDENTLKKMAQEFAKK